MTARSFNYPTLIPRRPTWAHDRYHPAWPNRETTETSVVDRHPERCICTNCARLRVAAPKQEG